jgi:hypothetical protein
MTPIELMKARPLLENFSALGLGCLVLGALLESAA